MRQEKTQKLKNFQKTLPEPLAKISIIVYNCGVPVEENGAKMSEVEQKTAEWTVCFDSTLVFAAFSGYRITKQHQWKAEVNQAC